MSGSCESCAHWERLTYDGDHARGSYEDPEPGEWGRCVLIGDPDRFDERDGPEATSERAFTRDGSDYWSSLVTRADFGCVEHQPREDR